MNNLVHLDISIVSIPTINSVVYKYLRYQAWHFYSLDPLFWTLACTYDFPSHESKCNNVPISHQCLPLLRTGCSPHSSLAAQSRSVTTCVAWSPGRLRVTWYTLPSNVLLSKPQPSVTMVSNTGHCPFPTAEATMSPHLQTRQSPSDRSQHILLDPYYPTSFSSRCSPDSPYTQLD